MMFSTTSAICLLLSLGSSASAGPIALKSTYVARAGNGSHVLYLNITGEEHVQTLGSTPRNELINITISEKKGGGGHGHGGGGRGSGAKPGTGGSHGTHNGTQSGASKSYSRHGVLVPIVASPAELSFAAMLFVQVWI